MKLRQIILLKHSCIALLLILGIAPIIGFVLLRSYAELERKNCLEDLERGQNALKAELQGTELATQDYATWDVTYEFAKNPTPDYERINFSQITMQSLRMQMVVIVAGRRILFFKADQPDNARQLSSKDEAIFLQIGAQVNSLGAAKGLSGIVSFSDGPALVAARHIVRTSGLGPSEGILIMARKLDSTLLGKLSSQAQRAIDLKGLNDAEKHWPGILTELHTLQSSTVRVVNSDAVDAYVLMNDPWGQPSYILSVRNSREIWREGLRSAGLLAFCLIAVTVFFISFDVISANDSVVKPLEVLVQYMQSFRMDHGLKTRIHQTGTAEIVQLGEAINQMIDEIQVSEQSLIAARERLRFDATHDALTGSWNRAAALELLDREMARGEREGSPVSVLMLDLDHFKEVNDCHGHAAGDQVLQAITSSIGSILRASDILARYGGEEFLIVAPSCSDEQAVHLAERIRLRLHSQPIVVHERQIPVTASIGFVVGSFPFTSEELIALADRALYRAKANGRNRVEKEEARPTRAKGMLYSMPRRTV